MSIVWQKGAPPNEVMVWIKGSNCWGEYVSKAMRKDYKKPTIGKTKKAFRKGWRWIDEEGNVLGRKDMPEAWAFILE